MADYDKSREQELLEAVLESPDADEPREAYAQWCEQQKDAPTKARAEFIRCQLALADFRQNERPRSAYSLRYLSEKLTREYGRSWGEPLAEITRDYMFDRGFVELITLSAEDFLKHAPRLFALAPVRHLKLTSVTPELFVSPHLESLRSIELDRCDLTDVQLRWLTNSGHLSKLRWLSLAENHVTMDGARALARAWHLKHLAYANFYGNAVNLNEQYAYDSGFVVDSFMPDDGLRLEAEQGRINWLHHDAKSIADAIPNRFRIRAAGEFGESDMGSMEITPNLPTGPTIGAYLKPPEMA